MIVIVDYDLGNTGSVLNALSMLGRRAVLSRSKEDIKKASHIILPGVGTFAGGMCNLERLDLIQALSEAVISEKKPFLGICLGMQLCTSSGEENGIRKGLGWVQGVTRKFKVNEKEFRIPHIGWDDVAIRKDSALFRDIDRPIFYFAHSFHVVPENKEAIAGTTDYGETFVSALESDNIMGVQFHPEKSQKSGIKVLENFLNMKKI